MHLDEALLREALAGPCPLPMLGNLIDLSNARGAAVIVPVRLAPEPRAWLILRASHLVDHAGEVGFPGGKPDPGDASLEHTALRELAEELDVGAADVEIVGSLVPVPVITGRYLIHAFVGLLSDAAAPRVASPEIARVIELPIVPLLTGERTISAVEQHLGGVTFFAPHFEADGAVLYGASAYILYELLARLAARIGRPLPPPALTDVIPWGDRYSRGRA